MAKREKQRVPSVEEIQELQRRKKELATATIGATGPVMIKAPLNMSNEPRMGAAVRISTPPVGLVATDQSPKTLSPDKPASLGDILISQDLDPAAELLRMYNEREEDINSPDYGKFVMKPNERRHLMLELLKYTHPQLKSIDHKGMTNNAVTVILNMPDGTQSHKQVESRGKVIDA